MKLSRHAWAVLALLVVAALGVLGAAGQSKRQPPPKTDPKPKPAEVPVPFRAGEKLDYRVLWSTFSVHAAKARLAVVERRAFRNGEAWHFQAVGHTVDPMRLLYALDDQFDSYSEPTTLASLQYEVYLREQGKKEDAIYRMSSEGDPAPGAGSMVRVLPGTRDPVGFLYYLRAVNWQSSREVRSPVFDGKKLYEVRARLELERDEVSVPAGTYAASRIGVRVYERGSELEQTRFTVWLTRDASRLPVLMEAEVPVGSTRVELTRVQ